MPDLIGSLIYSIILTYMLLEFEVKPKKNLYLIGLFVTGANLRWLILKVRLHCTIEEAIQLV